MLTVEHYEDAHTRLTEGVTQLLRIAAKHELKPGEEFVAHSPPEDDGGNQVIFGVRHLELILREHTHDSRCTNPAFEQVRPIKEPVSPGPQNSADKQTVESPQPVTPFQAALAEVPKRLPAILAELQAMHDKKNKDYGTNEDPLANVRAGEEFGIPAWAAAVLRANDKLVRIKSFLKKGNLANESVEDSILDSAVYYIIALILYREQNNKTTKTTDLKYGDTVILKSGGPYMKVIMKEIFGNKLHCTWTVNKITHMEKFHPDMLIKCQ
jgi:uncharacterized protein YodC (DUF2158 family)